MNNKKDGKNKPCVVCEETITDLEIRTVQSGWFSIMDKDIEFCPYCGRKLITN